MKDNRSARGGFFSGLCGLTSHNVPSTRIRKGFGTAKFTTVSTCAYTANAHQAIVRKFNAHAGDYSFLKICVGILGIIAQISRISQTSRS